MGVERRRRYRGKRGRWNLEMRGRELYSVGSTKEIGLQDVFIFIINNFFVMVADKA